MNLTSGNISVKPLGVIHSSYSTPEDMPIQSYNASNIEGTIEIFPEYSLGLQDLDHFSYIIVIYHFHKMKQEKLIVKPFLDIIKRGVFSTRAPIRPNHIGLSIVKLLEIKDTILYVQGLDIIDGTPLLDIKPYIPKFDTIQEGIGEIKIGWLEKNIENMKTMKDDGRFLDN